MKRDRFPAELPIFKVLRKYVFGGEYVVGVGFDGGWDMERLDTWISVLVGDFDQPHGYEEQMPPESLLPLTRAAREMLDICKAEVAS